MTKNFITNYQKEVQLVEKRKVTATGRDKDGDITHLCNKGERWSHRSKSDAIEDINNGICSYRAKDSKDRVVDVKVVRGKNLSTEPDESTKNNLGSLPRCEGSCLSE